MKILFDIIRFLYMFTQLFIVYFNGLVTFNKLLPFKWTAAHVK